MPTEKDVEWLQGQGARAKDNKAESLSEKEPSLAEEVLGLQKEAVKIAATRQALGLEVPSVRPAESLASTIVTKSMDATDNAIRRLNEESAGLRKEILELQKQSFEHQNAFFNERMERIQDLNARVEAAAQNAQNAGAPKSAFENYKEVKAELAGVVSELVPPRTTQSGVSDEVAIALKKMEIDQQRLMEQMRQDSVRQDRQFTLQLKQFDEESRRRWAEYQDTKTIRTDAMEGLQDVLGSLGKSLRVKTEDAEENSHPAASGAGMNSATPGETSISGSIAEFPCQFCKTKVPVEKGDTVVTCPNSECGAKYEIKPS